MVFGSILPSKLLLNLLLRITQELLGTPQVSPSLKDMYVTATSPVHWGDSACDASDCFSDHISVSPTSLLHCALTVPDTPPLLVPAVNICLRGQTQDTQGCVPVQEQGPP